MTWKSIRKGWLLISRNPDENGNGYHHKCLIEMEFDENEAYIKDLKNRSIGIPKGATNKDVFKAVFGYDPATDAVVCNKEDWCGASEPCKYCISNPDNIGREWDWWNAPYKKEVEE